MRQIYQKLSFTRIKNEYSFVVLGYHRSQSRQGIAGLLGLAGPFGSLGGPGLLVGALGALATAYITRDVWDDFLSK